MTPKRKSSSGEPCFNPTDVSTVKKRKTTRPSPIIVGIGASAGGHKALEDVFTNIPADCGLAFVVVMHLPADGPSLLPDILRHHTSMTVHTAEDGMSLCPNTIHVPPPGKDLMVRGGRLYLQSREGEGRPYHPIDSFFSSLADDFGPSAIAVVLSGFGSDGSEGVKKIKENGGIVLIQDPETATNPFMPQNAFATGVVDAVLPAKGIAEKLSQIAQGNDALPPSPFLDETNDHDLHNLLALLKERTGQDFSSYKRKTLLRRIERRMVVNGIKELSKYLIIVDKNTEEARALCQEFLIGVTNFFRDPQAFELLQSKIIPSLFANRKVEEPLRIWHACCATGEEAYSVAMLILEYLDNEGLQTKVQIFATDLDEVAIAQARAGLYADDLVSEVSEERLKRFFTKTEGRWQVTKQLREMIVFAQHNIIKDPPFSRLDLLVCRNFLIYLNPDIQKLLIPLFHQVLNPGGFLFLGSAETVGYSSDLFASVDAMWKIFRRQGGKTRADMLFPLSGTVRRPADMEYAARSSDAQETATFALADKLLLERYAPARILINESHEVVHFSSRAGEYLLTPEGKPTKDLLKIIREELRPALRAAIYKAFTDHKEIVYRGIKVIAETGESTVNIIVLPLIEPPPAQKLASVIIELASSSPIQLTPSEVASGNDTNSLTRHLEEQLRVTSEQLQSTSEQLETSNERFLLANEELMTVNEELQSTNEELQSTNEELVTVNAELQRRMEELNQSNSDLQHLFTSSEIATIFLNRQLLIKRFSPAMAAILNLLPADVDRPVHHLNSIVDWSNLEIDATSVLENLTTVEREVNTRDGRSYIMRVHPYRTTEGLTDGIVVTLIDITKRKEAEAEFRKLSKIVQQERDRLSALINSIADEVWFADTGKKITLANPSALRMFGFAGMSEIDIEKFAASLQIFRLDGSPRPLDEAPPLRALRGEEVKNAEEIIRNPATGESRYREVSANPVRDVNGNIIGSVSIVRDITERKRGEKALHLYELLSQNSRDIILFIRYDDGRILEANAAALQAYGYNHEEILKMTVKDLRAPNTLQLTAAQMLEAIQKDVLFETKHRRKDGTIFPVEVRSQGGLIGDTQVLISVVRDITKRMHNEEALQHYSFLMKAMGKAAKIGGWELDTETGKGTWTEEVALIHEVDPKETTNMEIGVNFYTDDSKEKITKAIQDAIELGQRYVLELELITAKGSHKWVRTIGYPVIENNKVVKLRGSFQDITERKKAEGEQEKLQIQLTQAQKMESVGRLAGGIAHDFNNMLSVIIGYAELALDQVDPLSSLSQKLQEIFNAAQRSADITKQLLAFARKQTITPKILDLNDTLEGMLKMLRRLIGEDIDLAWLPGSGLGKIKMDPSQLDQLLANLCVNSRDAIRGVGKVNVETGMATFDETYCADHEGSIPGDFLRLTVGDDGCGMDKEILNNIFEPFFTTKKVGKGTGLGLATVYGIVKQNNGFVNVYSEPGQGATFNIYLPVHQSNAGEIKAETITDIPLRGKETILIVEDEPSVLALGKTMLERLGYTVLTANTPFDAIGLAEATTSKIHMVLTDVIMPEMNGLDLSGKFHSLYPGIKTLFMSGYTADVIAHRGILDKGVHFIHKPFSIKDLAVKVREALEQE